MAVVVAISSRGLSSKVSYRRCRCVCDDMEHRRVFGGRETSDRSRPRRQENLLGRRLLGQILRPRPASLGFRRNGPKPLQAILTRGQSPQPGVIPLAASIAKLRSCRMANIRCPGSVVMAEPTRRSLGRRLRLNVASARPALAIGVGLKSRIRYDGNKAVICERSDATRPAPARIAECDFERRRLS